MMLWRKIMMFAALLILTSAAYDLIVVDFWSQAFCDEGSQDGSKPYPDDDCFCCCAHIVLTQPTPIEPVRITSVAEVVPSEIFVSAEPTGIYHPPRI
jgi:hypothetical protein